MKLEFKKNKNIILIHSNQLSIEEATEEEEELQFLLNHISQLNRYPLFVMN